MSSEKYRNISPIAFPAMTAELEGIVQDFKENNRPAGQGLVKLILLYEVTQGKRTTDEVRRIFRQNFGRYP